LHVEVDKWRILHYPAMTHRLCSQTTLPLCETLQLRICVGLDRLDSRAAHKLRFGENIGKMSVMFSYFPVSGENFDFERISGLQQTSLRGDNRASTNMWGNLQPVPGKGRSAKKASLLTKVSGETKAKKMRCCATAAMGSPSCSASLRYIVGWEV
jgi:hypothetical protein